MDSVFLRMDCKKPVKGTIFFFTVGHTRPHYGNTNQLAPPVDLLHSSKISNWPPFSYLDSLASYTMHHWIDTYHSYLRWWGVWGGYPVGF